MCSATVGATPVYRWTCAASATFSNGSRGTPCWANTLNRVPELPNAHEGSSIRWVRSTACASVTGLMIVSMGGPPAPWRAACHGFRMVSITLLTFRLAFPYRANPQRSRTRPRPARAPVTIQPTHGDVFAEERQQHIARIVEEHGRARVAELSRMFGV